MTGPETAGAIALRADLAVLMREPLRAVRYLVPSGWRDPAWDHGGPHQAEHGVELENRAGTTMALLWEMEGTSEYLSARLAVGPQEPPTELVEALDVSDRPAWQPYLGERFTQAGAAWHVPAEGEPRQLWAVRLGAPQRPAVTVALGELRGVRPTYLPDSVVVLFGQEQAEAYRIASADLSAWGADLAPDKGPG
jgi:hypothetical protein